MARLKESLSKTAATFSLLLQAFGGVVFVGVAGVGSCYLLFDQCNVTGNSTTAMHNEQVIMDGGRWWGA